MIIKARHIYLGFSDSPNQYSRGFSCFLMPIRTDY